MKTWHWVVILVIVGIILLVCGFFLDRFFLGWPHRNVNQYELFRDLLVIILALAGLAIAFIGLVVYELISKGLETKVEKKVAGEVNYAISTIFLELSYDYWRAYEIGGKFQRDKTNELERAIEKSKKALTRAERLDTKQKIFEFTLCLAKNNLAYHLAARNRTKDTEKAISLAKYAYDRAGDFDFEKTCHWMETYGFVLIRMGTEEQQIEGRKIIKDVRDRRYLPKIMRDSIEGKYTKELTLRRSWD